MSSPVTNYKNKRRFSASFSPVNLFTSPNFNSPMPVQQLTKKKLIFNVQDSPSINTKSTVLQIDDSSCDSGFSESKTNDIQSLDDSFQDIFDNENIFDSPMSQVNRIQNKTAKKFKTEKFNDDQIKKALEKVETQTVNPTEKLIGDMTRTHTLPILSSSKHSDLASITPQTLASVINGDYKTEISDYMILDARYPYEFEGGHIEAAESAYIKENIFNKLFNNSLTEVKPEVLIFHCEFSSERGPKLMREIREKDRMLNKHQYPSLNYPEIYLLEGGYKCFYEEFASTLCQPQGYLPMHHDQHRQDLKYFRSKSKSWDADTKKRLTKSKLKFF